MESDEACGRCGSRILDTSASCPSCGAPRGSGVSVVALRSSNRLARSSGIPDRSSLASTGQDQLGWGWIDGILCPYSIGINVWRF
jgi:hypothetical protein